MNTIKSIQRFMLLTALVFCFAKCSLQKRHYMGGYHIEWKKHSFACDERNHKPDVRVTEKVTISAGNASVVEESISDLQTGNSSNHLEVKENYKVNSQFWSYPTSHNITYSVAKQSAAKKFETKTAPSTSSIQEAGGKNQFVALLLCIFLGWLGIHRFYLNYTGMGLLYLFTFGILGIGWLIDTILLIIPNGLTPKGKTSYDE